MQYTINYSCGHAGVQQLFGKSAERERRVAWLEGGSCPDCFRKQQTEQHQAASQTAQGWAAELRLPVLVGSEKQCSWAETIRQTKLAPLAEQAKKLRERLAGLVERLPDEAEGWAILDSLVEAPFISSTWAAFGDWLAEHPAWDPEGTTEFYSALIIIMERTSAKEWIDQRYRSLREEIRLITEEPRRLAKEAEAKARLEADQARTAAEARARKQAEEEAARQVEIEKNARAHAKKDEIRQRIRDLGLEGYVSQISIWQSGADRRIYLASISGRFGDNIAAYYVTGNRKNKPGTIEVVGSQAKQILKDRMDAFRALLDSIDKGWNSLRLDLTEKP